MSSASNEEVELAYGSGHINPIKALHPGLIYEADGHDYVRFLCSQGLNATEIRLISGKSDSCSNYREDGDTHWNLNYPSMALSRSAGTFNTVFYRTVTNVGSPNSAYRAAVKTPEGQTVAIKVHPRVLKFKSAWKKLSFRVNVWGSISRRELISASLVWDDGKNQIRSPIVVYSLS